MEDARLSALLKVLSPPAVDYTLRKFLEVVDRDLAQIMEARRRAHPNPLARYGRKCFSQSDEDGITLEIVKRLGLEQGTYAEFGVGNGLENNTLILMALGWKGFWAGGEDLAFEFAGASRFHYLKCWLTLEDFVAVAEEGSITLGVPLSKIDVISLDLDGNDLYFARALLEAGCNPSLFIVEYNAKFPPPVRFCIAYDAAHEWGGDDYYGASLCSFVDLFSEFGYRLVCCNAATGSNAFFVPETRCDVFGDVAEDINAIYSPPHFHLLARHGHPASVRTIEQLLKG